MKLESYLEFAGVEVANINRTLTYVRDLGDPRIIASVTACDCESILIGPFSTPQSDPAPWYNGTANSAGFLGFLLDLRLNPSASRAVEQRAAGGATVGPLRRHARILEASGLMFAATPAAMSYGEDWLERTLRGENEDCASDEAEILRVCPGTLERMQRVGLIDGPVYSPSSDIPECVIQQVAFQLIAGSPYLLSNQQVALSQQQLTGKKSVCFTSLTHTAVILTVIAGTSDVAGVDVYFEPCQGYVDTYADSYDPVLPTGSHDYAEFEIADLPAGSTLTVDSAARTVQVTDSADRIIGGFDALEFLGAWRWLEAFSGAQAEVHVDATGATVNGATSVRIETVQVA